MSGGLFGVLEVFVSYRKSRVELSVIPRYVQVVVGKRKDFIYKFSYTGG